MTDEETGFLDLTTKSLTRTSIMTCCIPDGPSWKCEKTRFSDISRFPTRLVPDIAVFTKEWRLPI
jgi:hypothetical protein